MNEINIKPTYSKGYEDVNLELINVTTNEQGQKLVSGRELHDVLEIGTQYKDWIKRMIAYGFQENVDYTAIAQKRATAQGNMTTQIEHILTLEMAKHIAMVQRTEIGMKVRNYFIECEKVAHNPYANLSPELQMLIKLEQGQTELNQRVGMLENNMTIDYSQQETLRLAISTRVYQLLGDAKENAKLRSKVYSNLHRCIKRQFSVNSYKNIAVKEFEEARSMITTWMPDEIMMLAIQGAKSQMSLM